MIKWNSIGFHPVVMSEKLLALPTVSSLDPKVHAKQSTAFQHACSILAEPLLKAGFVVERLDCGAYANLVATTDGIEKTKLWLAGHLDVVPASDNQFVPVVDGDKMKGRGSNDMKGKLPFLIAAAIQAQKNGIGLIFTSDEEVGSKSGTHYLFEQGLKGDVVILPEGGHDADLVIGQNGNIWAEISAVGNGGHTAVAGLGISSVEQAFEAGLHLRNLARKYGLPSNILAGLGSGGPFNVVPSIASVKVDLRFPDKIQGDVFMAAIAGLPDKFGIEYSIADYCPAWSLDTSHSVFKTFSQLWADSFGTQPTIKRGNGSSDGGIYAEHGMTVLMPKTPCGGYHGEDEWVGIGALYKLADSVAAYIEKHS